MIKLFRNIRRKLAVEGKTSAYLRYAVGEIVLVVIGILIALNINNWNSNRIKKQKENVYLTNIKRDLKEQLKTIEIQIDYETYINNVATPIMTYYKENQSFKVDSVFTRSIGILTGRTTFIKNSPTYTELISSGNIDIIGNDNLKDDIISYYQELERIELIINKNNNLFTDAVFIPEILKISEIGTDIASILDFKAKNNITLMDLNETRLKEITKKQLENPENELKMINCINFRNILAILHIDRLNVQKEKTQILLEKLESKNND